MHAFGLEEAAAKAPRDSHESARRELEVAAAHGRAADALQADDHRCRERSPEIPNLLAAMRTRPDDVEEALARLLGKVASQVVRAGCGGACRSDGAARWCRLGGLTLPRAAAPEREAEAHFLRMEVLLAGAGLDFEDVARTWCFLDAVASWFAGFNETRKTFFGRRGLHGRALPASTGVGAPHPEGGALTSGLLALRATGGGGVQRSAISSHLQCEAKESCSFFGRATERFFPNHRRLLVSGTANINEHGRPLHAGDAHVQIERTLAVVHAILASRGTRSGDVTRAVAYFADAGATIAVTTALGRACLPDLLFILARGDICFPDLPFEIEIRAVARA